jgi:hypothetical protein
MNCVNHKVPSYLTAPIPFLILLGIRIGIKCDCMWRIIYCFSVDISGPLKCNTIFCPERPYQDSGIKLEIRDKSVLDTW